MSEKLGWYLATILLLVFAALSFHLASLSVAPRPVPVFLPLAGDGGGAEPPPPGPPGTDHRPPPAPSDLETAGAESMTILRQAGRIGPTASVEDFVRGLLLLEKEGGALALSAEQKRRLLPIVREAFEHRKKLLELQTEFQRLETEVPDTAARMMEKLSVAQAEQVRRTRDIVSLHEFEDPYWQKLIARLENP